MFSKNLWTTTEIELDLGIWFQGMWMGIYLHRTGESFKGNTPSSFSVQKLQNEWQCKDYVLKWMPRPTILQEAYIPWFKTLSVWQSWDVLGLPIVCNLIVSIQWYHLSVFWVSFCLPSSWWNQILRYAYGIPATNTYYICHSCMHLPKPLMKRNSFKIIPSFMHLEQYFFW